MGLEGVICIGKFGKLKLPLLEGCAPAGKTVSPIPAFEITGYEINPARPVRLVFINVLLFMTVGFKK
jgi:hypothetical protein